MTSDALNETESATAVASSAEAGAEAETAAAAPEAAPAAPVPAAPAPAPATPAEVGGAPAAPAAPAARGGLSTFLKVSIILLIALSVAAIALVFIGDFEGKVERITATFLIFAVFVALTGFDTSRNQRNGWYAPVALIANSYILALLLIVTWMSAGGLFLGTSIFWKSLVVIAITRAVVACCEVLLGMGDGKPEPLGRFAFVTGVLAVVSGILFTAPLAIEVFEIEVPELYWKIAVAALLLTGLGLAVTLLLRWSYGAGDREARHRDRVARAEEQLAAARAAEPPAVAPVAAPQPQDLAIFGQATAQPLLPWPTFADGRPIPSGPDGQPDFSVPGAPLPPR
ncbi:MAG: hypothetical protein KDB25_06960 [Leucobacter sp.]|nr:hypothetical protein [Leucobacter sp.]